MEKTIGQIAYEAAAKVTNCDQPWSKANQAKWEAAAEAVKESVRWNNSQSAQVKSRV